MLVEKQFEKYIIVIVSLGHGESFDGKYRLCFYTSNFYETVYFDSEEEANKIAKHYRRWLRSPL